MRFLQHHQVNNIPAYVLTYNERLDKSVVVVVACEKIVTSVLLHIFVHEEHIQEKKFIVVRRGLPTKYYMIHVSIRRSVCTNICNQKIREVKFSVHTVSSLAEEVTQESYYNRDFYKAV